MSLQSSLSLLHDHEEADRGPLETWQAILFTIPSSILTLWIIVSNLFVIVAVLGFRHMRTPSNIYIASLASTDFLVGILILPPSIFQILHNEWTLGVTFCKLWLTLDVTLSTLSILHLVAIALDRYRVVTDGIHYLQGRRVTDVLTVIICLWTIGIWIATPPVLGWADWSEIEGEGKYICDYSSTLGYVIHSTFGSFLMPMTVMVWTYLKIYQRIQTRLRERPSIPSLAHTLEDSETESRLLKVNKTTPPESTRPGSQIQDFIRKKIRFSLTKERRAARTLGIIIGAFMICWLPFCVMYFLRPIAGEPPLLVYHGFTWLGYFNSALNPIIYCVYSREYREVFRDMLFCNCGESGGGGGRIRSRRGTKKVHKKDVASVA